MINYDSNVDTWMFREDNEVLYLVITILIVLTIGFIIANINIYIVIFGLVAGLLLIKLRQAQLIGNALEVSEHQFPDIYSIFIEHKSKLKLNSVKLYINQDPSPNAFTMGFPTASIILTSALVENFSKEELSFTIGHELGHVKAGHNIILTFISPLGSEVIGASLIFSFWNRKAEYSCDKCGLILTKKIDSAIMSLLRLSIGLHIADKVNLESYKNQVIGSENSMVKASAFLFDHPLTTQRVNKLVRFWKKNFIKQ